MHSNQCRRRRWMRFVCAGCSSSLASSGEGGEWKGAAIEMQPLHVAVPSQSCQILPLTNRITRLHFRIVSSLTHIITIPVSIRVFWMPVVSTAVLHDLIHYSLCIRVHMWNAHHGSLLRSGCCHRVQGPAGKQTGNIRWGPQIATHRFLRRSPLPPAHHDAVALPFLSSTSSWQEILKPPSSPETEGQWGEAGLAWPALRCVDVSKELNTGLAI